MLPKRIYLKDFMGHIESDIDCTKFNSCLIVGKNKNNSNISNGVGKSTIYKAIDFVLYGEYSCDKIEEIIRDGVDSCKVIFEFETEKVDYQIIRQRGKSGTHIYLNQLVNNNWESITAKTNTQTEEELLKLIKISYKAFKNSIYFAQSDFDGISSVSSDKRKELLKEPLNISVYNKYHKIAKKKLDLQTKELEKNSFIIESLKNPEEELKECIIKISQAEENLVIKRANYDEVNIQLNNKRTELYELNNLINSESLDINGQLVEVKQRIKEIELELLKTNQEYSNSSKTIQNYKNELTSKISALEEKNQTLKALKSEELKTPTTIQNEIDSFIEKEQRGRILVAKLEAEKIQYSKPVPNEGKCESCFQKISSDHKEKCIQKSKEKLEVILKDLEKYQDGMRKCTNKRKSLEQEQKDISRKLSQISSFEIDIANSNNNITKTQQLIEQYNHTVEAKNTDIIRLKSSLEALKTKETVLIDNAKKFNIQELNNKIVIVKNSITTLELNIKSSLQQISSDDTLFGILKEKKNNIEENILKLAKYKEENKVLEYKVSILQKTLDAFLNDIPEMIIGNIINDLQQVANEVLQELRPDLFFKFKNTDEVLDIEYYLNNKLLSYKLLSGGQKTMIALSFKLGLSKIIQKRLGVDIKFLLLDEVDQALDQSGVMDLSKIIKKWQTDFKIFTITHNKNLSEQFNDFIIVEKNDEGSNAQYSTNWN